MKKILMSQLDRWADSISQKTFNNILIVAFGVIICITLMFGFYIEGN